MNPAQWREVGESASYPQHLALALGLRQLVRMTVPRAVATGQVQIRLSEDDDPYVSTGN